MKTEEILHTILSEYSCGNLGMASGRIENVTCVDCIKQVLIGFTIIRAPTNVRGLYHYQVRDGDKLMGSGVTEAEAWRNAFISHLRYVTILEV